MDRQRPPLLAHHSSFVLAMVLGITCEIIGYAARMESSSDQFDDKLFFMQVCCLTIGPVFMAAALYLCMRQTVVRFAEVPPVISAKWYTRIVSCVLPPWDPASGSFPREAMSCWRCLGRATWLTLCAHSLSRATSSP